ncbi:transcription elongation factor spt5 [Rhizina undulata]
MSTSNMLGHNFDSEEEDNDFQGENASGEDVDAEGEPDDEPAANGSTSGHGHHRGHEEDDEDDEDDEEDDDEEDEEEEEEDGAPRKRPRRIRNQFLDVEAEVDEDEEDIEEEEDDRAEDGFIQDDGEAPDISDFRAFPRDDHRHRELDRQHEAEQTEDMEAIAAGFKARHGKSARRRMGDSEVVPRRLLLPSVNDPSIWGVKCRPGKEREIIFAILRKQEELRQTRHPLQITSAFERGNTMSGYIYVEARKQADVLNALQGISNVFPMSKMILVPIKEMPDLLYVVKKAEITPGTWVRFKRGKYQGDLAQVENVLASGLEVRIRMVPRLDYGNTQDANAIDDGAPTTAAKRKRAALAANSVTNRPPQRLFSEQEAKRNHAKYLQNNSGAGRKNFTYLGEEYEDGYLVKDVKLTQVSTENVNPTLEEVAKFASGADDGTESLDLNALAQSLKNSVSTYQPGDAIEVYDGEQQGLVGKAVSVHNDIVTMDVLEGDLKGKRIEVPFKGLRKRFREGDHVKVMGGSRFRDEVGMVVKIVQDRVTILSDLNMQEITVFSKDLREASDTGIGNPAGKYDLHDLVQLDMSTVACVVKVDRESLRVLDQNGNVRVIVPSQVSTKISSRHGVATDRNGSEIRVGDTVKETGGETRTGVILHTHRMFAFLHSRDQTENAGVFVSRTNNIATIAAKGGRINSTGPDLTKMNPALQRNGGQNNMMPPPMKVGGRDKCIGQTITIRQGPYKGLMGIIKDATDISARVELHTKNKTITIDKAKLGFRDSANGAIKTYQEFIRPGGGRGDGGDRGGGGYNNSGMSSGSRTPQIDYSAGSRTPAWMGAGSRTPAWMSTGDGGRTPAYNAGGKTPAWGGDGSRTSYGAGSRTPAWNPSSRTPYIGESERSAWDAGSKTPGRPSFSNYDNRDSSENSYSARTPGAYSASSPEFSAQGFNSKEFSAPTPGLISAPTPSGAISAPTPGPVSAPTPSDGYSGSGWGADTAPTPAPYGAAPTPGASGGRDPRGGYYAAPTPAAGNPRTPGIWGGEDEEIRYAEPATP